MPSFLRDWRYYKKFGERTYYQEKNNCIEGPLEEAMQRVTDIVNMLRPLPDFEDDENRVVTEEILINDDENTFEQIIKLD